MKVEPYKKSGRCEGDQNKTKKEGGKGRAFQGCANELFLVSFLYADNVSMGDVYYLEPLFFFFTGKPFPKEVLTSPESFNWIILIACTINLTPRNMN